MKYLFLLAFILIQSDSYAQNELKMDSLFLFRRIVLDAESIHTDSKNHIYVLTHDNEVILLNPLGEIMNKYSNNYLGRPQFIYVQNPLQVILFYPDFQTIVVLDQALNELNKTTLNSYRMPRVSTIGYSPDKSIWYYEEVSGRIKMINKNSNTEVDMILPAIQKGNEIKEIRVQSNEVLIIEPNHMVHLIDIFGKLKLTTRYQGILLDWHDKIFLYFDEMEHKINSIHEDHIDSYHLPVALSNIKSMALISNGIVCVDQNGEIHIFHYQ